MLSLQCFLFHSSSPSSLNVYQEILLNGSNSSPWLLCPNFVRKTGSEIFISLSLRIHRWMLFSKAEEKVLVREKWLPIVLLLRYADFITCRIHASPFLTCVFVLHLQLCKHCTCFLGKIFSFWIICSLSKWMDSLVVAINVIFRHSFLSNCASCNFISSILDTQL